MEVELCLFQCLCVYTHEYESIVINNSIINYSHNSVYYITGVEDFYFREQIETVIKSRFYPRLCQFLMKMIPVLN